MSLKTFDAKKYSRTIGKIRNALNVIIKEKYFKEIARDILSIEKFKEIIEGPSTSEF